VQKGVLFSGSRIYNHLPLNIKLLSKDIKVFKSSLRRFLIENVFYSIDEYYNLLLNEHVMVSPINNVLIIVFMFDYCLIGTGLFYSGSQCSHYPCRSLIVYIYFMFNHDIFYIQSLYGLTECK
jgi:hypothetical protein